MYSKTNATTGGQIKILHSDEPSGLDVLLTPLSQRHINERPGLTTLAAELGLPVMVDHVSSQLFGKPTTAFTLSSLSWGRRNCILTVSISISRYVKVVAGT